MAEDGTIEALYEAFSRLDLRESLPVLITETGPEIIKLVQGQLEIGELPNEDKIYPTYRNIEYARKKAQMNALPGFGVPDIKLTGQLYDQMYAEASGDEYEIGSRVEYANDKNILQYGDNLFDMSENSKQEYCDETLLPAIEKYITETTGIFFE